MDKMKDYEKQGLLHEIFQQQAEKTPEKKAVVESDGKKITFKDLNDAADVLATNLRIKGVKPDTCVGIYMQKSIEFTIAYIGTLKAGGAYLPLDVSYPAVLLASILQDAQPVAILTSEDLEANISDAKNVIVLKDGWLTQLKEENEKTEKISIAPTITLDNLAYVVYTSGTTGRPKGIMCPHRGAVFSYHWRHLAFPYKDDDREACNIFFVWEMFRPLQKGVPMYIIPTTVIYDPPLLCDYIKQNKITRMLFTPSLLEAVLNMTGIDYKETLKSLRLVLFCGEVVTTALFERCMKLLPWIQFLNLYSVSECHDVACEDLSQYYTQNKEVMLSRKFCPVGRLLPGVKVVILDPENKPQPVGASGEIYVGGPTLARGYVNRPEQQALRFISRPSTVPEANGDILYKTGDWGYILSDGSFEICGRCDSMVKIRGYSIEVQAVEAALMELRVVNACVVMVIGKEGEDKFLVAYIVPEGKTSKKEIRGNLKRRIPFYMIPSYFVFIPSLPVVESTGKLDKKALPPFDKQSETEVDKEALPSSETEKQIAEIWSKVLQTKDVDIHESFFDLGGHSLLATELLVKLREKFSIALTVQDLFTYSTIASLSRLVDAKQNKSAANGVVIPTFDLKKEVDRHDQGNVNIDMQLRAFWRILNVGNMNRFKKARVLLTGATGFLGAFILQELLLKTKTLVYCLVREHPDMNGMERIEATLQQYGMLTNTEPATEQQRIFKQIFRKRVHAVKGNVPLVNLGMSDEDFTYLCTDTDYIIHAAASVNLVYPYSALQGPNVMGTSNIVMFACTGKIKPIHYISTDAVFPHGLKDCVEEDNIKDYHDKLTDGYSQSKWVAERLISKAGQKGIPVTIYRLGNLSGDSKSAHWNPQDFNLLMLQACAKCGVAPDIDWYVEMTPVDFAAEFIVKMTYNLSLALGKTFHVINSKPLHSRWIFEWMNAHGFPVKMIPFDEWRNRVVNDVKLSDDNGQKISQLQRLLESYAKDPTFFTELSTYKTENLHQTLHTLQTEYPYTNSEMLQNYFTNLSQRHVVPAVRRYRSMQDQKILNGKVAIVTGASSGIGKAIACALSRSGAKVAMAARRVERLQEIQKELEEHDGIAIAIKTDVSNREEVKEMVRHTESVLGPVDIIVNNAGMMFYTLMKNLHEDEWEKQIDINIKGLTNCIGAVLTGMINRKSGHIVNLSSDAGRRGFPGLAVYSGTKFYVEGLSQALRHEVKEHGIRVTCIQPGDVQTELLAFTTDKEAQEIYDGSSKCKILEPDDIARSVVYAVSQPDHVGINEILVEPREGCV